MKNKLFRLREFQPVITGEPTRLDPVSLELNEGELLVLEGPNGSGKTTFVRTILNLRRDFRGSIERNFSAQDTRYLPQLANTKFYLPMTLRDVVGLWSQASVQEIVELGLLSEEILARDWNTASGGERKKALLTGVMLMPPRLLVLDEPLNHLDERTKRRVNELLTQSLRRGSGIVLISHHLSLPMTPEHVVRLNGASA